MRKALLSAIVLSVLGVATVVALAQPAPLAGRWLFQAETGAGTKFPILTLRITTDGGTPRAEVTRTEAPFEVTVQSFDIDQSRVTVVTKTGPSELIFRGSFDGSVIRGTIDGTPFDGLGFVADRTAHVTVRELLTLDAFDTYVAFSPDGRTVATATRGANEDTPGELKLWDVATDETQGTLMGHVSGIAAVAFSPDSQTLATGGLDKMVKLWDVATRQERLTLSGHVSRVIEVVFSPDGKTLATSTDAGLINRSGRSFEQRRDDVLEQRAADNEVKLWDVETGQERASVRSEGFLHSDYYGLAFSPDGTMLSVGSGNMVENGRVHGRVTLWDLATLEPRLVHEDPPWVILAVAFSPDGQRLASGGYTRTPRLWDVATGDELMTLGRQATMVYALAFSPDGEMLVTGSGNATARATPGELTLWDAATGSELASIDTDGHGVMSVAFSPDGTKLAVGLFNGNAEIWKIAVER